jgi:YgiT-type zinc finger domain-containing protein
MFARNITVEEVAAVVGSGETIASYPDDKPFPKRLVLGRPSAGPLHVVVAEDPSTQVSIVVTTPVGARLEDEEKAVTCVLCRNGTLAPGTVTVVLQRERTTVILKQVPADVCPNCGEYYLSNETTALVLARADAAARSGAEVEIAAFAA